MPRGQFFLYLADTSLQTREFDSDCDEVEVCSGSQPIAFTLDGTTPNVGSPSTYVVFVNLPLRVPVPTSGNTVVKIIALTADTAVTVTKVR